MPVFFVEIRMKNIDLLKFQVMILLIKLRYKEYLDSFQWTMGY